MPPEALVPDVLQANGFTRVSVNHITEKENYLKILMLLFGALKDFKAN